MKSDNMLRIMKLKAMETSDDDTQCHAPLIVTPSVGTSAIGRQLSETPIVSHVPISISTRIETSSAESTISSNSDEEQSCRETTISTSCRADESSSHAKKNKNTDSPDESSRTLLSSSFIGAQRLSLDDARQLTSSPKPLARGRCISVEDQESCMLPPVSKRQRLLSIDGPSAGFSGSKAPMLDPIVLLARDEDESVLSPLHAFIRKQIEVFTATSVELRQPAPGRKQPIQLHQVGLRCIHCKTNPNGRRVKRAVCYPTNVGRIYHSVSDMKFDHFSNCAHLPTDVRAQFESLKAEGSKRIIDQKITKKGSVSSTAQYYHDSAVKMGMFDGPQGIFMSRMCPWNHPQTNPASTQSEKTREYDRNIYTFQRTFPIAILNSQLLASVHPIPSSTTAAETTTPVKDPSSAQEDPARSRLTLDEETDEQNLNEIHCFVRKHIEFFAANKNDIAAPAPGRKTRVVLGQVGIRCIHCLALPPRHRVKRAICYPPSVSGIYHAVSNMKFDHFASCRGLPTEARQEFRELKETCCRKGSGGNSAGTKGTTSSTKKYYEDSAIRKGLMDSENGIRFVVAEDDKAEKDLKSNSVTSHVAIPCGLSALVKAACQAA